MVSVTIIGNERELDALHNEDEPDEISLKIYYHLLKQLDEIR